MKKNYPHPASENEITRWRFSEIFIANRTPNESSAAKFNLQQFINILYLNL